MSPLAVAGIPSYTGIVIIAAYSRSLPRSLTAACATLAGNYTVGVLLAVLARDWLMVAVYAAVLAGVGIIWWKFRRKGRKKALALTGAKARARIAAMVTSMRERARPRPVLRPGLQGAR